MNAAPKSRAHLVERAVEAMAGRSLATSGTTFGPQAGVATPVPAAAEAAGAPGTFSPPPPAPGPAPPQAAQQAAGIQPPGIQALGIQALGSQAHRAHPGSIEPISVETLVKAGLAVPPGGIVRSRLSEEIAVVQHSVLRTVKATRATDGRCPRIVMVTSARPGEGKTFMSLNLAASLANSGTRPVVLVDVDGKHMSISHLLDHDATPGLRVLAAEPTRAPVTMLIPTAIKRLSLISYGPVPTDTPGMPPGQLITAALLRLAAALPDHLLVLDTPPCLSTSDPGALAPIAGQVLMVVEAERTQRSEVEAALDMVDSCPTLQLVLNRAVLTANDTFGAYGGYGAYGAYPGS